MNALESISFLNTKFAALLAEKGEILPDTIKQHLVNVKSFGAKGDGETDDSKAINNAIKASEGRVVYFPQGVYAIKSPILAVSNKILLGIGNVIIERHSNTRMLVFPPDQDNAAKGKYFGINNVKIINIGFEGNGHKNVETMPFHTSFCDNIEFLYCNIHNVKAAHIMEIGGSKNVIFKNCKIVGFNHNTDYPLREMFQLELAGVANHSYDIIGYPMSNKNIRFEDCYFGASEQMGVVGTAIGNHWDRQDYYNCEGLVIKNCVFEGFTERPIRLYKMKDVEIKSCKFINTPSAVSFSSARYKVNTTKNVFIRNNHISCNSADGYNSSIFSETIIDDNNFEYNTQCDNLIITGNVFDGENKETFIDLHDVNTFVISNNLMTANCDYAVKLKNVNHGLVTSNLAHNINSSENDVVYKENVLKTAFTGNSFSRLTLEG